MQAPFPMIPGAQAPSLQARPWDSLSRLSSVQRTIEQFLSERPFERAPWLAVAFGTGIAGWVVLPRPEAWGALIVLCIAGAIGAMAVSSGERGWTHLAQAVLGVTLMVAAGCGTIWAKSVLVGHPAITRPTMVDVLGTVTDREDIVRPDSRGGETIRVLVDTRIGAGAGRVRLSLPLADAPRDFGIGAVIRMRARLMPPSPPMLPGAHDFAMDAWFQGIVASGTAVGPVVVLEPAPERPTLRAAQQALARHIRGRLSGSPGAIAAALASGDRGAVARSDEDAMRDAGLTHLLSISGLHVSAVIAAVYALVYWIGGLVPGLALRLRLPLVAAGAGALAGIGYMLITGAEVPTIRSVAGSLLVLLALALGRDPLSLRLLAVAAFGVMLFWPEAVLGPSFQMSFASVATIIAFHHAAPVQVWLAPRDEGWLLRVFRHGALLLAAGLVIELALAPIALFHFHRAGIYGSLANVVAIPLTTFLTMPLIALALLLDCAGWGAPVWWAVGWSLDLLLGLAHHVAAWPGAVTIMPLMPRWVFGLVIAGLFWLGLWSGRVRLWGLVPALVGMGAFALMHSPDILVSGDGRTIGFTGLGPDLVVLGAAPGSHARNALLEQAGMSGQGVAMDAMPGAHCNADFCVIALMRPGIGQAGSETANRRVWLLIARTALAADEMSLAAVCERVDIVIARRRLPLSCQPRLLRIDRALLDQTGGLTIDFRSGAIRTVAATLGLHGWVGLGRPRDWPAQRGPDPSPQTEG